MKFQFVNELEINFDPDSNKFFRDKKELTLINIDNIDFIKEFKDIEFGTKKEIKWYRLYFNENSIDLTEEDYLELIKDLK